MAYEALAGAYDGLMTDVNYPQRIRYIERLLRQGSIPIRTVVDLGCGTGTITCALAQKGYVLTGIDPSIPMLTQAMEKAQVLDAPPQFIEQSMEKLRLPSVVDGVISTVDAVNYVTAPKALQQAFCRVYKYLKPGGRFIFDVNTVAKFRAMDGATYVDETPEAYCVWQTVYSEKRKLCTYWVDMFTTLEDGTYLRTQEAHTERGYEAETLEAMVTQAGFTQVAVYGDLTTQPPAEGAARIVFVCDKLINEEQQ